MILRIPIFPLLLAWLLGKFVLGAQKPIDWQDYEQGGLGVNPQVKYKTTLFTSPIIHVGNRSEECAPDHYVFLAPRADRLPANKAMILDNDGNLVWHLRENGAVNNFQVQRFKGQDYLTYWVGDDGFPGHGRGYYKMLDHTYRLAYTISAASSLDGDYHEFSITRDDTALITTYVSVPYDLSAFGRPTGFIWDCVFQEVDVETNELLFDWRASDHFNFSDMAVNSWTEWTGYDYDPWDWFHLNSVEKDSKGNFLIAARYTNAITYINGRTGKIMWNLGGSRNDFTDLSNGLATTFVDPHMARWTKKEHSITVFDNLDHKGLPEKRSHGLEIEVNQWRRSAKIVMQLFHPENFFAKDEGSIQVLQNDNYFVGYGSLSAYAEFSANNTLLCNAHYSPLYTNTTDAVQGYLQSYRIYKHKWVGHPEQPPAIKIIGKTMHISWNGATRVKSWKLDGRIFAGKRTGSWNHVGKIQKRGFETKMDIKNADYSAFQLTALDLAGDPFRAFHVHLDGLVTELFQDTPTNSGFRFSLPWLIIVICVGAFFHLNRRYLFRLKKSSL